ncbi:hypothetical protein QAD02_022630 [Eretmocerus hayati]|uniref:Uncharacterized protein n=1 Tax=Eretmocerus hayati TaxID=131215 RepID=A0ACC2PV66_9HYME|nr:hypothetical protein QAD02_022630 [Eretmocerus hayati]
MTTKVTVTSKAEYDLVDPLADTTNSSTDRMIADMELGSSIQIYLESKHRCNLCSYRSRFKTNLDRHKRNVHSDSDPRFKCDSCDFRTKYKSCLDRHFKSFHEKKLSISEAQS